MIPVVLTYLPNTPTFIGTFDTDNWVDWWKSEPLPGQVEQILQSTFAYGQYHLARCKMLDGTWSVFQSKNYGVQWTEVWNHPHEISLLIRLDYGWMIAATADGWYESVNAGTDWDKVSSEAPDCKAATVVGENVLIAHDGRYIWRSTDYARNWAQTFDCESIWAGGDIRPTVAGVYSRVFAGCGPYLITSENYGVSWRNEWKWQRVFLRQGIVSGQQHGYNFSFINSQRVSQIVLTGVTGETISPDVHLVIRSSHIQERSVTVPGGLVFEFPGDIVRHYHVFCDYRKWHSTSSSGYKSPIDTIVAKFDQWISPTMRPLTAYDIIEPGTGNLRRLVVSAQTHYNTQLERDEPAIKYSVDCGEEWADLDVNTFKVYDGPDLTQEEWSMGGPFTEEAYISLTWNGPPCHNSGWWELHAESWKRGLSHDMDMLILSIQELNSSYPVDVMLVQRYIKALSSDIFVRNWHDTDIVADLLVSKAFDRPYLGHTYIQDDKDKGVPTDLITVRRRMKTWLQNLLQRKAIEFTSTVDIQVQGEVETSYGCGMFLVKSHYDEQLVDIEKTFPQMWDIRAPHVPFEVEDSRRKEMGDEWP